MRRTTIDFLKSLKISFLSKMKRAYKIVFRYTHSNIFFTLLNYRGKVVSTYSAGSVGILGSKRRKTTNIAVQAVLSKMFPLLFLKKVRNLVLIFIAPLSPLSYGLVNSLSTSGFNVSFMCERIYLPHNGPRLRKLRRT